MNHYELLALRYLADLWEQQPGDSEDGQTCRQHAQVLRLLLTRLQTAEPGATEGQIKAVVHQAREAGY